VPCVQEGLPENGWSLPYDAFGYYGGFSDDLEHDIDGENLRRARICHECVVAVLKALPKFAERLERGTHPCDSDEPCCEYAWRFQDSELQIVSPDKQWCLYPFRHRDT